MAQIKFADQIIDVPNGSTVLDTLLERGYDIPHNCKAGACQSCLMQATKGDIPQDAQKGLKDSLKAQQYFLACSCQPENDMTIHMPEDALVKVHARVTHKELLSPDVLLLKVKPNHDIDYFAGQYLTIWKDTQVGRSYSIASVPELDDELAFHIKRVAGGLVSNWLHDELRLEDEILLQNPAGDCIYTHGDTQQKLLMIGTGTGLAPLYGIIKDALQQGLKGEIHLFHGAVTLSGLYMHEALSALAEKFSNLFYHPTILNSDGEHPSQVHVGQVQEYAQQIVPDPSGWKSYLCGDPGIVNTLRKQLFLRGCDMKNIYADAFLPSVPAVDNHPKIEVEQ